MTVFPSARGYHAEELAFPWVVVGAAFLCCLLSWVTCGDSREAGPRSGETFQAGQLEHMALEGRMNGTVHSVPADNAGSSVAPQRPLSTGPLLLMPSSPRQQAADRCLSSPLSSLVPEHTAPVGCDGLKGRSLVQRRSM